jgi:hypothetical protein
MTLNGALHALCVANERMRLDIAAVQSQLPKDLDEGIKCDLLEYKQIMVNCGKAICEKNNKTLVDQMNDVFSVINDAVDSDT